MEREMKCFMELHIVLYEITEIRGHVDLEQGFTLQQPVWFLSAFGNAKPMPSRF